jgi:hypothetical protein
MTKMHAFHMLPAGFSARADNLQIKATPLRHWSQNKGFTCEMPYSGALLKTDDKRALEV